MTHRRFVYIMHRSSYEREWGKRLEEPNWFEKFLAILLKIIPPIGPLADLRLRIPTPQVEQLFMASFDKATKQYADVLNEVDHKDLVLPDKNYDVGVITPAGVYRLNDDTQAFWLHKLAEKQFAGVTRQIRLELLHFYSDPNAPIHTKEKPKEWQQTLSELARLRGQAVATQ